MVFSRSREAQISHLQQMFDRVRLANLKLNIRKCEFANAKSLFLGHTLSLDMVQPRQQKLEALLQFPAPQNKKQVQSLLGLANYKKFLSQTAFNCSVKEKTFHSDGLKRPMLPLWT